MDLTEKESLLSSPSHFNPQWSTFFPATIERSRKPESPGLAILRGDKKRTRGNSKYGYYVMGTCASPLPPLSKNKGIDSWNSARRADKTREGVSLLSPPNSGHTSIFFIHLPHFPIPSHVVLTFPADFQCGAGRDGPTISMPFDN